MSFDFKSALNTIFVLFLVVGVQPAQANSGKVFSIKGAASINDTPLTLKSVIKEGDVIKTAENSSVKLVMEDKSILALHEKTNFTVREYVYDKKTPENSKITYKLARGALRFLSGIITKKAPQNVKIEASTATIGIRGTFGFISSSPTKTIVANKTGAMSASNVDPNVAGSQLVGANSVSTIPQGQAPSVPQTMSNTNFNSISTVVLGRIGTSLPSSMFKQDSGTTQQSTSQSSDSSGTGTGDGTGSGTGDGTGSGTGDGTGTGAGDGTGTGAGDGTGTGTGDGTGTTGLTQQQLNGISATMGVTEALVKDPNLANRLPPAETTFSTGVITSEKNGFGLTDQQVQNTVTTLATNSATVDPNVAAFWAWWGAWLDMFFFNVFMQSLINAAPEQIVEINQAAEDGENFETPPPLGTGGPQFPLRQGIPGEGEGEGTDGSESTTSGGTPFTTEESTNVLEAINSPSS